jgi:hypothetical protein
VFNRGLARYSVTSRVLIGAAIALSSTPSAVCEEQAASARYTERSFLFLWSGQHESDAKLNLLEPIVTDRPDFTEASSTVGKGVVQAELGYTYYYQDIQAGAHQASHVYPELLLRAGVVSDWFEMRLGQTLVSLDEPLESSTGLADTYIGAKVGIVPQHGVLPELSIVPQLTVPSGSSDLRADTALYGVNFLYSWSIFSESYLGASTQFNQREAAEPVDTYTSLSQAFVIGTRWDSSWGSYAEWFAIFADSYRGDPDSHFANGGITYLVNNNVQLDVRFGTRLQNYFGEEIFAGLGLSVRYF